MLAGSVQPTTVQTRIKSGGRLGRHRWKIERSIA
jgi:hypothetical protein